MALPVFARCGTLAGATPLHLASYRGHLAMVRYLVEEAQANVDAQTCVGDRPVHWAARGGQGDVLKYYLEQCNVCF